LAIDAFLTTLRPLLENVMQIVAASFRRSIGAPVSWLQKPVGRDLDCMTETDRKVDPWNPIKTSAIQSRSRPMRFLGFSNHKKGAPSLLLKHAANGLQHILEKWVERCKKCIPCQGKYFEKETATAPPQSSDSE
jgi:hypothetical protein